MHHLDICSLGFDLVLIIGPLPFHDPITQMVFFVLVVRFGFFDFKFYVIHIINYFVLFFLRYSFYYSLLFSVNFLVIVKFLQLYLHFFFLSVILYAILFIDEIMFLMDSIREDNLRFTKDDNVYVILLMLCFLGWSSMHCYFPNMKEIDCCDVVIVFNGICYSIYVINHNMHFDNLSYIQMGSGLYIFLVIFIFLYCFVYLHVYFLDNLFKGWHNEDETSELLLLDEDCIDEQAFNQGQWNDQASISIALMLGSSFHAL
ncbi:hypothetical protein ACJX0J_021832 [Zea mays]